MRYAMPRARPGQVVGLLGGSFDPPHQGHLHISHEAIKRFRLDRLWWLVSPGNPLKPEGPAPLTRRMAAARDLARHPRVEVTDIEARLGTRYTAETLGRLFVLYPGVRFVWLMGADNLASLHRWQNWQWIMRNVPVGVLARPGQQISARTAKAAQIYRPWKLRAAQARGLGRVTPPAWCFLNVPMVDISSSEIRASGHWVR
ncbi:MAG: nicotinic acid mononucleotide adenylyltransferase [Rhodobacteraceae bacterium CG17_big_fil_post_rev_8_21_14_2_50_65_11]|nr:MAG: nicotinic acid mononucleotide adenylyltransferase [Rhodobacteraceae bacterium CG17_big_fil_post_rev_8_21_14_2_50_65_11]